MPIEPAPLPRSGLCASCGNAEVVRSQRSAYLRCALADRDPRFARYPLLPVVICSGFAAAGAEEPGNRAPRD